MNGKKHDDIMNTINQIDKLSSINPFHLLNFVELDLRQVPIEDILNDNRFNQLMGINSTNQAQPLNHFNKAPTQ